MRANVTATSFWLVLINLVRHSLASSWARLVVFYLFLHINRSVCTQYEYYRFEPCYNIMYNIVMVRLPRKRYAYERARGFYEKEKG